MTTSRGTLAIIQARMRSTRLPGKVLADLGGASALARVVNRTRRSSLVTQVVVATSTILADEAIVNECASLDVPCFRGSEDDVLDRYYQAARYYAAESVVRITADCPVLDPGLLDELISAFLNTACDYGSNALPPRYPRGLGAEIFTGEALSRAWQNANQAYQRVHVTPYFYQNTHLFRLLCVVGKTDHSHHRWTLDTAEDLALIRSIYSRFQNRDDFSWEEVLELVEREPQLSKINCHVLQKQLQEC
ncbi:MAG TPA: glycosyltransferase family protein [Terracidiphilus sp.]|nr:glycosyltransferase family protein [Terracidiphilus sp.]